MPVIVNTTLRLIGCKMKGFKVTANGGSVPGYITLYPNIKNEVTEKQWAELKVILAKHIDSGAIGVMSERGVVTGDPDEADKAAKNPKSPKTVSKIKLSTMTPAEAKVVIHNTDDSEIIEGWIKAEKKKPRRIVMDALQAQLKEIKMVEKQIEDARKAQMGENSSNQEEG